MKHLFVILAAVSMFLMASTSPYSKKLIGVWKIQSMDINGNKMLHQQLGQPFIEFNDEGGFLIKLSTSSEKGRYKLNGNILTLKFVIPKKPALTITITKLDDRELDYTTSDSAGVVKATCYRITQGIGEEKD